MQLSPDIYRQHTANAYINTEANCYFSVLGRQNFAYAKNFLIICRTLMVKIKPTWAIFFYFLTLPYSSLESMIFVTFSGIFFSLRIQIQFTSIFERSDSQEFLLLEIKKHGKCVLATTICLFIRTWNFVLIRF